VDRRTENIVMHRRPPRKSRIGFVDFAGIIMGEMK
jgi:hypothetical protein